MQFSIAHKSLNIQQLLVFSLLGFYVRQCGRSSLMYCRNILPLSPGLNSKPRKKLAKSSASTCFLLISYLADSSTLKTQAVYSSETSIKFYQTAWHHIQKEVLFTVISVRTSNPTSLFHSFFTVFVSNGSSESNFCGKWLVKQVKSQYKHMTVSV